MSDRSYDLIARLGRGGMGVVDLARDAEGSKVALKRLTLHGSASDIARARQRLLREADVLRKLHHPNVVRLLDVVDEGDEIVLVMPYMAGGSLAERVAQHGPAPAAEVERQARRLLGALASAHQAGVVHRDIKPANVLFDERGEPCLADFGVALSRDQTHGLTAAGMVVGTPGFMAPEQARGEAVSPATDVFSLGATLLFAATGGGPYGQGDPGLLMVRAASGRVERVPASLPRSLRRLLRPMLDPRPERRPDAAALAGAGTARGATPGAGARAAAGSRRRAWLVVGAVVATAAAAAAGLAVTGAGDGDRSRDAAGGGAAPTVAAGDCTDLPYQPCGRPPAPNTDGTHCIDGHDDYDGIAANGCEAAPDDRDGERLETRIEANIVPRDDVDTYVLEVADPVLCEGGIEVRLDAPPGMVLELELRDHLGVVDRTTTGVDGVPALVRLTGERCAAGERTAYDVVVRAIGEGRVTDDYVLTRAGGL